VLRYFGEGQLGDMKMKRGNQALRDHIDEGRDVHLFTVEKKGKARYRGQFVCAGYRTEQGPDRNGADRRVYVFELVRFGEFAPGDSSTAQDPDPEPSAAHDLQALRDAARATGGTAGTTTERKVKQHQRSDAVRKYAKLRAAGVCEGCDDNAPFLTVANEPYLEVHHIRRLSDGGPDDPAWVAALCPTCHRRAHYAQDREVFNKAVKDKVDRSEKALGFP
jgi:5-methylcytosine-specific restriction protein A